VAKYNQLLRIEDDLGPGAAYLGGGALTHGEMPAPAASTPPQPVPPADPPRPDGGEAAGA
jgi:hypothetical protein